MTAEDASWRLARASSNKPELVVAVESPVSEKRMRDMFAAVDAVLRTHKEVCKPDDLMRGNYASMPFPGHTTIRE